MNKRTGKYKKLIPQAALLVFMVAALTSAIVMFGMTSLGWFAQNRDVTGDGMSVEVYADRKSGFTEYDAFKYDFTTAQGIKIPGTVEDDGTLHLDMVMNDYDTIFTFRNIDAPLIIRFKLEGGSYEEGEKLRLGLYRYNPTERPTNTTTHPNQNDVYLSDVVFIQCAVINTSVISENASPDTIYQSAKNFFENGAGLSVYKAYFVDNSSNQTDENVVSTTETITNAISKPNNEDLFVYFYINYDISLITTALQNQGAQGLTTVIPLYSDVYQFKIEDVE